MSFLYALILQSKGISTLKEQVTLLEIQMCVEAWFSLVSHDLSQLYREALLNTTTAQHGHTSVAYYPSQ